MCTWYPFGLLGDSNLLEKKSLQVTSRANFMYFTFNYFQVTSNRLQESSRLIKPSRSLCISKNMVSRSFRIACGGMSFANSVVYLVGGHKNEVWVRLSSPADKQSPHSKVLFGGLPAVLKA